MGILDKIFDKKICAVCGGEIGLIGNRKLADGNLCKDCAKKLSPFMTDRRESTVEEIKAHLAYREHNARVLLSVNPTRVFGRNRTRVYVDEKQGLFFVTDESNYMAYNPDVMRVDQVIGFNPTIHENRTELYHHDREGHRVPYNPPRYRVEYRFDLSLDIRSPYFNRIAFEFSGDRPESRISDLYRLLESEIIELQQALDPANYAIPAPAAAASSRPVPAATSRPVAASRPAAQAAPGEGWTCACGQLNQGNFCTNCGAKKPVVFRCDKCGWTPEDPTKPPKFCPNCGDPFNEQDQA